MRFKDVERTRIECEGIQTFAFPDGSERALPVYRCGGFIGTLEGWNLFAQCSRIKDYGPYYEAKAAYLARHMASVDGIQGGQQA